MRYNFVTPYSLNVKGQPSIIIILYNYFLIRCRGKIENNRNRSLTGFQTRFEVSLLMYNLRLYHLPIN